MQKKLLHRQLTGLLPPKQQTLEFAKSNLWQQLPTKDQRACRDALAELLYQVIETNHENDSHE